ncbi:MAG: hypothetical protein R3181_11555 [Rubricoccaceae bacterium]|nr:hypothetical protein [Rubricoccaceae bacterium]
MGPRLLRDSPEQRLWRVEATGASESENDLDDAPASTDVLSTAPVQ